MDSANPNNLATRVQEGLNYALPPMVLSAWGMVMLHTWMTGRTKMLLHPFFQPLIAIAGGLLLLLAFAHLCYYLPRPGRFRWVQWLVLLLPVLAAAVTAPKSFSDQMIAARGVQLTSNALSASSLDDATTQRLMQSITDADPTKPLPMDVLDLVTIAGSPVVAQKLEGRTLRMRGQYYGMSGSDFKLLRLVMYCCAADATPVGVLTHGQPPDGIKNMDWLELEGPVHFVQSLGQLRPEVTAQTLQKVAAPSNPYAY